LFRTFAWASPSPQLLWLSLGLSLLALLCFVAFHPRWRGVGSLSLQGQLLLSLNPLFAKPMSAEPESAFQQAFQQFEQAWPQLQMQLDFEPTCLRIKYLTPHQVWTRNTHFAERLQQELQSLLQSLPPDKYLAHLHLTAELAGLAYVHHFSFAIYDGLVVCQPNLRSRFSWKGRVFYG